MLIRPKFWKTLAQLGRYIEDALYIILYVIEVVEYEITRLVLQMRFPNECATKQHYEQQWVI